MDNIKEIWKNIIGYEGLYQVSSEGRVKSLGNGSSNNSKERILKSYKNKDGYLGVILYKYGKQKKLPCASPCSISLLAKPK